MKNFVLLTDSRNCNNYAVDNNGNYQNMGQIKCLTAIEKISS